MTSKSDFPPEGQCRLNANVPIELHQKLKMASVMLRMPMGTIIQKFIQTELDALIRKGIQQ